MKYYLTLIDHSTFRKQDVRFILVYELLVCARDKAFACRQGVSFA